jgi:hypothetical protein
LSWPVLFLLSGRRPELAIRARLDGARGGDRARCRWRRGGHPRRCRCSDRRACKRRRIRALDGRAGGRRLPRARRNADMDGRPHAVWDEFSGVVDDFEERADSVLVRLTVHGRARGSGIALEQHYLAPVEGAGWEALAGEELHRQAGGGAGSLRMSSSMAPGRWEPSPMRATGTADAHAKGHSARIAPPAPGAPLTAGCEAQMLSW